MSGRRGTSARRILATCVVAAAVLACSPEGAAAPATPDDDVVRVVGTDDLRWEPEELEVEAGDELELVCEPAVNHNLVIVETGEQIAICAPGEIDRGTVDLEPGSYTFLCTVPGHSASMRGELTVAG